MSEEGQSAAENTNDASLGATATNADKGAETEKTETTANAEGTILASSSAPTEEPKDGDTEQSAVEPEKADGEKQGEQKEPEKEGAPESYEDFKAPEGTTIDGEVSTAFKSVAKELDLSQEQAQSVVDKMTPVMVERQKATIAAISKQWAEASAKDPEIGGAKWKESCTNIARLRDKFAKNSDGTVDKDIAEFMNSPFGNHPGVLKLLSRAGHAFGEASFPTGAKAVVDKQYTASDFYKDAYKHQR